MASKKEVEEIRKSLKSLTEEVKENRIKDLARTFDQFINRDMKSYEDNFRITGLKYDIKDAQKDGDECKDAFINRILNLFVTAKIIPANRLFYQEGKDKGNFIAGVLRNLHPLGQRSNAAIVVAFTQSWMTGRVRQRLQNGAGVLEGQHEGVKIHSHFPPVIEAIRNEAMKERRRLLAEDNVGQRVVVNMQFKKPWVQLIRMTGRDKNQKEAITFPLEDGRLEDPGRCLAELALEDKEFVPKHFLEEDDQVIILPGIYPAIPIVQKRRRGAMDTS